MIARSSCLFVAVVASHLVGSVALAQSFYEGPVAVGPIYGAVSPPVNVPITGMFNQGYPGWVVPNGFVYATYGGIGPYGGPAYGRLLAGSNVIGYSNSGYSSFSGQYGGLGVPLLSNRVGGYSASSSGFSVGSGGGVAYGSGSAFGYTQPGLVPGVSGSYPFGVGAGGFYPLGAYGSIRSGGASSFLPRGGY
jgi:hypothetical protein